MKIRKNCCICGKKIKSLIKLDNYPLTEGFSDKYISPKKLKFNQEFQYCDSCEHGQLSNILDNDILYNKYTFRTGDSYSKYSNNNLKGFIKSYNRTCITNIIDIGCNDGYLLKNLIKDFDRLVGIDPMQENKSEGGIEYIKGCIEDTDIDLSDFIVTSHHVIEHLEDPKKFIKNILDKSNENTIIIFSFPSLEGLINNIRFDAIFHHHLNYFSIFSICKLLDSLNVEIIDIKYTFDYYGCITVVFKKNNNKNIKLTKLLSSEYILKQYRVFKKYMELNKEYINTHADIYCYGATFQFPILKYYISNIEKCLGIIDDSKNKENMYPLGINLKIVGIGDIIGFESVNILVTANNFSKNIVFKSFFKRPLSIHLLFGDV